MMFNEQQEEFISSLVERVAASTATAISNNRSSSSTSSAEKLFTNLPGFSGFDDVAGLENWNARFENIADSAGWDDSTKFDKAAMKMTDTSTMSILRTYKREVPAGRRLYSDFYARLLRSFIAHQPTTDAVSEWSSIKRTSDESIAKFVVRYRKALLKIEETAKRNGDVVSDFYPRAARIQEVFLQSLDNVNLRSALERAIEREKTKTQLVRVLSLIRERSASSGTPVPAALASTTTGTLPFDTVVTLAQKEERRLLEVHRRAQGGLVSVSTLPADSSLTATSIVENIGLAALTGGHLNLAMKNIPLGALPDDLLTRLSALGVCNQNSGSKSLASVEKKSSGKDPLLQQFGGKGVLLTREKVDALLHARQQVADDKKLARAKRAAARNKLKAKSVRFLDVESKGPRGSKSEEESSGSSSSEDSATTRRSSARLQAKASQKLKGSSESSPGKRSRDDAMAGALLALNATLSKVLGSTQVSPSQDRTNPNVECWECGGKGHFARDCPRKNHSKRSPNALASTEEECAYCHEKGHSIFNCPRSDCRASKRNRRQSYPPRVPTSRPKHWCQWCQRYVVHLASECFRNPANASRSSAPSNSVNRSGMQMASERQSGHQMTAAVAASSAGSPGSVTLTATQFSALLGRLDNSSGNNQG